MSERVQTTAEQRRRRPLMQYVITAVRSSEPPGRITGYVVDRSPAGSKPSHALIFGSPARLGMAERLQDARALITSVVDGARRLPRRRDDPVDVVEVWV